MAVLSLTLCLHFTLYFSLSLSLPPRLFLQLCIYSAQHESEPQVFTGHFVMSYIYSYDQMQLCNENANRYSSRHKIIILSEMVIVQTFSLPIRLHYNRQASPPTLCKCNILISCWRRHSWFLNLWYLIYYNNLPYQNLLKSRSILVPAPSASVHMH